MSNNLEELYYQLKVQVDTIQDICLSRLESKNKRFIKCLQTIKECIDVENVDRAIAFIDMMLDELDGYIKT